MPDYPVPLPNQSLIYPDELPDDPCPCEGDCQEYCVPVFPDDITTWLMTNPCEDSTWSLVDDADFTVTGLEGFSQDNINGSTNSWTSVPAPCGLQADPTSKILKPTTPVPLEEYTKYQLGLLYTDLDDCCYYFVGFNSDGSYDELGSICDPDQFLEVTIGKGGYVNYGIYLDGDCCGDEEGATCPCLQTLVLNKKVYTCDYPLTVYDKNGVSVGEGTVTLYEGFSVFQVDWSEIDTDPLECYTINQLSNTFCVKDPEATQSCFLEITYSNDEDAMGFYWPDGVELSFRIEGSLKRPVYSLETEKYRYSDGEGKLLTSSRTKLQEMLVAAMPEFMHDALSLAILHDTFEIEGVEYLIESGEYAPSWNQGYPLAKVDLQVSKKTQDTRNIYA